MCRNKRRLLFPPYLQRHLILTSLVSLTGEAAQLLMISHYVEATWPLLLLLLLLLSLLCKNCLF